MCPAVYLALIALALYYTDALFDSAALSLAVGDGEWVVVAVGWEMVSELWPLLAVVALVASVVTLFIARRLGAPTE